MLLGHIARSGGLVGHRLATQNRFRKDRPLARPAYHISILALYWRGGVRDEGNNEAMMQLKPLDCLFIPHVLL
jgi:hypothetical protein